MPVRFTFDNSYARLPARLYARLGWTRVGEIPGYALMPRGGLSSTTYFYKELDAPEA